jgi:hypothetical protein
MLIFGIQCKDNYKKTITKSIDRGGLEWIIKVIKDYNRKGLRTLVLIKE